MIRKKFSGGNAAVLPPSDRILKEIYRVFEKKKKKKCDFMKRRASEQSVGDTKKSLYL